MQQDRLTRVLTFEEQRRYRALLKEEAASIKRAAKGEASQKGQGPSDRFRSTKEQSGPI